MSAGVDSSIVLSLSPISFEFGNLNARHWPRRKTMSSVMRARNDMMPPDCIMSFCSSCRRFVFPTGRKRPACESNGRSAATDGMTIVRRPTETKLTARLLAIGPTSRPVRLRELHRRRRRRRDCYAITTTNREHFTQCNFCSLNSFRLIGEDSSKSVVVLVRKILCRRVFA